LGSSFLLARIPFCTFSRNKKRAGTLYQGLRVYKPKGIRTPRPIYYAKICAKGGGGLEGKSGRDSTRPSPRYFFISDFIDIGNRYLRHRKIGKKSIIFPIS